MSGIVGILHLDGSPVDRGLIEKLTEYLSFRGPDGQGVWGNGNVALGHTLLRTTLTPAEESERDRQPFTLDGDVWIVADARIDAQRELISELRSCGEEDVNGRADAELILRAYRIWGEGCVLHLLGDFAFAIWDGPQRRLFCARDQMGVKPFFYAHLGRLFIFNNTLNCIRRHPSVSSRLNDLAIADFLIFEANQDAATTSFADSYVNYLLDAPMRRTEFEILSRLVSTVPIRSVEPSNELCANDLCEAIAADAGDLFALQSAAASSEEP